MTWAVEVADHDVDPVDPGVIERVPGSGPHDAFLPVQLREEPSADAYAQRGRRGRRSDPRRGAAQGRARAHLGGRSGTAARSAAPGPPPARGRTHGYAFAVPTDDRRDRSWGRAPRCCWSAEGREVRSNPLAGSAPRSGDPTRIEPTPRRLMASRRIVRSMPIVVEAVAAVAGAALRRARLGPRARALGHRERVAPVHPVPREPARPGTHRPRAGRRTASDACRVRDAYVGGARGHRRGSSRSPRELRGAGRLGGRER